MVTWWANIATGICYLFWCAVGSLGPEKPSPHRHAHVFFEKVIAPKRLTHFNRPKELGWWKPSECVLAREPQRNVGL